MKIIQTFATDKYSDELNYASNTQMLFYHYCSLQCLRKVYGDEQDITLVTDTKGKELMNKYGFNYTEINTALDDYPYSRPLVECGYKGYSLTLYPSDDVLHLDNDVFIKKPFPSFEDTIVQGDEGNMLDFMFQEEWYKDLEKVVTFDFPDILTGRMNNIYNPGVIGFKSGSVVREEYLDTHNTYLNLNTLKLKALTEEQKTSIKWTEILSTPYSIQCINTILEEAVLYNLCLDNNITPTVINTVEITGPIPSYNADENNFGEYFQRIGERQQNFCNETGYLHAMGIKHYNKKHLYKLLGNINTDPDTTFLPSIKESLPKFLNRRYGTFNDQSIMIAIQDIVYT